LPIVLVNSIHECAKHRLRQLFRNAHLGGLHRRRMRPFRHDSCCHPTLSTSLKYLDNTDLQKLRAAVSAEIDCRAQQGSKSDASTEVFPSEAAQNTVSTVEELPEGKANLIRASFSAGLKPAAVARTFHVSPSLINRVIKSRDKPKR